MRKLIFAINITINGTADHTEAIADDELHDFFTNMLNDMDVILFGRKTYQLMENFWPVAHKDSGATKSMLRFADKINSIQKIVFSKTLKKVIWENTKLFNGNIRNEVLKLKKQRGKNISIGSLSIASELTNAGLIDEYWFLVHPIIGSINKQIFNNIKKRINLKLISTKTFNSGVVVLRYKKNLSVET